MVRKLKSPVDFYFISPRSQANLLAIRSSFLHLHFIRILLCSYFFHEIEYSVSHFWFMRLNMDLVFVACQICTDDSLSFFFFWFQQPLRLDIKVILLLLLLSMKDSIRNSLLTFLSVIAVGMICFCCVCIRKNLLNDQSEWNLWICILQSHGE